MRYDETIDCGNFPNQVSCLVPTAKCIIFEVIHFESKNYHVVLSVFQIFWTTANGTHSLQSVRVGRLFSLKVQCMEEWIMENA